MSLVLNTNSKSELCYNWNIIQLFASAIELYWMLIGISQWNFDAITSVKMLLDEVVTHAIRGSMLYIRGGYSGWGTGGGLLVLRCN